MPLVLLRSESGIIFQVGLTTEGNDSLDELLRQAKPAAGEEISI
jgi:hypothetical protein